MPREPIDLETDPDDTLPPEAPDTERPPARLWPLDAAELDDE